MWHNKRCPLSPCWLWLGVAGYYYLWAHNCRFGDAAAGRELPFMRRFCFCSYHRFSCQRTTTTKNKKQKTKPSWRHKCGRSCICFSLFTAFRLPRRTLGISLWSPLPTLINISAAACLPRCYCLTHTHSIIRCIDEYLQQPLRLRKKKSSDTARLCDAPSLFCS